MEVSERLRLGDGGLSLTYRRIDMAEAGATMSIAPSATTPPLTYPEPSPVAPVSTDLSLAGLSLQVLQMYETRLARIEQLLTEVLVQLEPKPSWWRRLLAKFWR